MFRVFRLSAVPFHITNRLTLRAVLLPRVRRCCVLINW